MNDYDFKVNYKKIKIFEAIDDNDLNEIEVWFTKRINKKNINKFLRLKNVNGLTFLHMACSYGYMEIVKYLTDVYCLNNITLDIKDSNNYTPIIITSIKGFKDNENDNSLDTNRLLIIKYLIYKGADIYENDIYFKKKINNVLHWSLFNNDKNLSEFLITNYFDLIFLENKEGEFPLDLIYKRKEFMSKKEKFKAKEIMIFALDEIFKNFEKKYEKNNNQKVSKFEKIREELNRKSLKNKSNFEKLVIANTNKISSIKHLKSLDNQIIMKYKNNKGMSKFFRNVCFWSIYEQKLELVYLLLKNEKVNLFEYVNDQNCFNMLCYKGQYNFIKEILTKNILFEKNNGKKIELDLTKLINKKTKIYENTNLLLAAKRENMKICNILLDFNIKPFEINNRGLFAIDYNISEEINNKCSKKYFELNDINSDNPFLNFQNSEFLFIIYIKKEYTNLILNQIKNLNEKYKDFNSPIQTHELNCLISENNLIIGVKVSENLMEYIAKEMELDLFETNLKVIEKFSLKKNKNFEKFNDVTAYSIIIYLINKEFNIENFKNRGIIINYYYLHNNIKLFNIQNEFKRLNFLKYKNKKIYKNYILKMKLYFGYDITIFFAFFEFWIWKNLNFLFIYILFQFLLYFNVISNQEYSSNVYYFFVYILEILIYTVLKEYYVRNYNEIKYICDIRKNSKNLSFLNKSKIFIYKSYCVKNKKITSRDYIYVNNFYLIILLFAYIFVIYFFYFPFEYISMIKNNDIYKLYIFPIMNGLLSNFLLFITIKFKNIYPSLFNIWYNLLLIIIIFFTFPAKLIIVDTLYISNVVITEIIIYFSSKLFILYIFRYLIPLIFVYFKKKLVKNILIKKFKKGINIEKKKNFKQIFNENNISSITNYKLNFILNFNVNIFNILLDNYDILFEYLLLWILWLEALIFSLFSKLIFLIFFMYVIIYYITYMKILLNYTKRSFTANIFQNNIFKNLWDSFSYIFTIIMIIIYFFKTYIIQFLLLSLNLIHNTPLDYNISPFKNKTSQELRLEISILIFLEMFMIIMIQLISILINDKPGYVKKSLNIEEVKKIELWEIKKKNKLKKKKNTEINYKEIIDRNKTLHLTTIIKNRQSEKLDSFHFNDINNLKLINN